MAEEAVRDNRAGARAGVNIRDLVQHGHHYGGGIQFVTRPGAGIILQREVLAARSAGRPESVERWSERERGWTPVTEVAPAG
jgi:hypothetical protein